MTKLKWGMIGGGEGSQIGPAHRLGALADGRFEFAAGALDHRPEAGREYAQRLGIAADRAYGDWQEMLAGEKDREDRIDLVTVATPNSTHYEITKAFLGEKPTVDALKVREDVTPSRYADFAEGWVEIGATILGGCCEVGPAHIAELKRRFG